MENHLKYKANKQTSIPYICKEREENAPSVNHASATHPSVCSRSRDYLETIFKKINNGENVLSRIPTRLDPNIEFSDDDEDELPSAKHQSPEKVKNVISDEKENVVKSSMETSEVPRSTRPIFYNNLSTQDRKFREFDKKNNIFSKFSSRSKVNVHRISYTDQRKTASLTIDPFSSFSKSTLNSEFQPVSDHKPSPIPNKNNIRNNPGPERYDIVPQSPSDIIQVNNKTYSMLSLLGSGGSCKVYSVIDMQNKSRVAIKRVNLKDTDPIIKCGYKQEIEFLKKLQNSDRVIKIYDFEYRENELLLVLEHGDIDFAKYISNEAKLKRLTPWMIKFFWVQMLEAVGDIHKYGIVHSDLKPANFLLVAGNLKLIDFGIATSVPDDKTSTFRDNQVGTLNYMSPEAITQMSGDNKHPLFKVGVKSDVWSLGCILYNLVYGVTPFHNIKLLMQKICAITNPNYEIRFKPLSDPLLLDVLKKCLKRNPKERASVEELVQHPYLAKDNDLTANASASKPNTDLESIVAQMQNLTPRRMKQITKVVEELTRRADH